GFFPSPCRMSCSFFRGWHVGGGWPLVRMVPAEWSTVHARPQTCSLPDAGPHFNRRFAQMGDQEREDLVADGVVSIREAGRLTGLCRSQIYNLARVGPLPLVKLGKRTLVPRRAIVRMLAAGVGAPVAPRVGTQTAA